MKKGYIYKIVFPNNDIYVGCTINIKDRINDYKTLQCKAQRLIYNDLKKYPLDSCNFIILEVCNAEERHEIEIFWIKEFNSYRKLNKKGLNLTMGGKGTLGSCQTGNSIRRKRGRFVGKNNPNYGRIHTEESRKKISDTHKGNTIWVGRKHKESSKLKISISKRGTPSWSKGLKMSQDHCDRIKERMSYLILDTQTGIYYSGTRDAAHAVGIKHGTLKDWLRGRYANKSSLQYV